MDDHWINKSNHNTLTYTSPNFGSFVLGVSYDDSGSASSSDNTKAGFSYSTTAGGLDIELGAGLRTAGKANDDEYSEIVYHLHIQFLVVYKQSLHTSQWMKQMIAIF